MVLVFNNSAMAVAPTIPIALLDRLRMVSHKVKLSTYTSTFSVLFPFREDARAAAPRPPILFPDKLRKVVRHGVVEKLILTRGVEGFYFASMHRRGNKHLHLQIYCPSNYWSDRKVDREMTLTEFPSKYC